MMTVRMPLKNQLDLAPLIRHRLLMRISLRPRRLLLLIQLIPHRGAQHRRAQYILGLLVFATPSAERVPVVRRRVRLVVDAEERS